MAQNQREEMSKIIYMVTLEISGRQIESRTRNTKEKIEADIASLKETYSKHPFVLFYGELRELSETTAGNEAAS